MSITELVASQTFWPFHFRRVENGQFIKPPLLSYFKRIVLYCRDFFPFFTSLQDISLFRLVEGNFLLQETLQDMPLFGFRSNTDHVK